MELFNTMVLLFLLSLLALDTASAWSQKTQSTDKASMDTSESKVKLSFTPKRKPSAQEQQSKTPDESKLTPRYIGGGGGNKYILEEDEGEHHPVEKEYHESEEHEDEDAKEHQQGYHNIGKKVEDSTSKDYQDKGGYSEFKEGGATFDKHKVDNTAENKENEAVRAHDAGEKFGGGALREHQLGKHKEKSVGHKKHGFKNVYHKEEYGDHKTFHDEFLDEDRHHEYDDEREERQLQGGRFSKGYRREGENKEFKEGDEAQSWGKEGKDGFREGGYEKGGHVTGHHLGHQKNEGHHEADGQRGKHAVRKYKKGQSYDSNSHDKPQYYSHNSYGGGHQHEPIQYHPVEPPYDPEGRDALSWKKEPDQRQQLDDDEPAKHRIQYGAPKPRSYNSNQPQQDLVQPVEPSVQDWNQAHVYNRREPATQPLEPVREQLVQRDPPVQEWSQVHVYNRREPIAQSLEPVRQPVDQRDPAWSSQFPQQQPLNHVNYGGHSRPGPPRVHHRNIPVSHVRSSPYPWWKNTSTQSRFSPSAMREESQAPSYYYPSQVQAPNYFRPQNRY